MLDLLILILSLAGLWMGAELVIKGALHIADHYKISQLFIGLTILTLGTDLPELFINVTASIDRLNGIETSGIILGDIIGSSFSQIGLILGIAGLLATLSITKRLIIRDGLMMVASVAILFLAGLDGEISRVDGGIFILVYGFYFMTILREEKLHEKVKRAPGYDLGWSVISLLAGLVVLAFASKFTIDSAVSLSVLFGVPQYLVGILVVGLGTSLPELATIIPALRRNAGKMVVGNLIGSNIFDILFALGVSSLISGFLVADNLLYFDIPALFLLSILVMVFFATKKHLTKKEAAVLVFIYLIYFGTRVLEVVL